MSSVGPKQAIFESLAEIAQAIGHANRLELLEHIAQGARSVEDLTALSGMSFANTSRHLQILRRARIVESERQGKRVLYSLASSAEVVALIKALGQVGERNLALKNIATVGDELRPNAVVEAEALAELLNRLRRRSPEPRRFACISRCFLDFPAIWAYPRAKSLQVSQRHAGVLPEPERKKFFL